MGVRCEKKLREVNVSLDGFIGQRVLNKFKDKARNKVFENQPYRDLIYRICGHASSMQLYHHFLTTEARSVSGGKYEKQRKKLLADIKGITLCMTSFGRVVVGDSKEFVFAYLRRGAKNIYQ